MILINIVEIKSQMQQKFINIFITILSILHFQKI